ncbi:GNAT family N-acetyltransferase [Acinetobacter sp. c2-A9]|uniref:GNAT family N-acetyltransferase n=1 Tax=Acinetobacter sp. c2-A9 TaxID=3342802 RepID=UPI0035B9F839
MYVNTPYFRIIDSQRPYFGEWLSWVASYTEENSHSFASRSLHGYADGKQMNCTIIYHGEVVGNVSFNTINHDLKKVEIGYWLSQDYQGKGIMTRAVKAMLKIAKDELGMQVATIQASEGNLPSCAIPERLGFSFDGTIKNAVLVNGKIFNHAIYSLDLINHARNEKNKMFSRKIDDDLSLALVSPSFAKDYWRIVSQQKTYLGQWLPWVAEMDGEKPFVDFAKAMLHKYADGENLTCAIFYQGELVVNISFNTIDHELKKVQIGYWLSQDYQGKGIMTRAVSAMLKIAKENYAIQIADIRAAIDNLSSRAVPERLGFSFDGIIKNGELVDGRILDHAVYTLKLGD